MLEFNRLENVKKYIGLYERGGSTLLRTYLEKELEKEKERRQQSSTITINKTITHNLYTNSANARIFSVTPANTVGS